MHLYMLQFLLLFCALSGTHSQNYMDSDIEMRNHLLIRQHVHPLTHPDPLLVQSGSIISQFFKSDDDVSGFLDKAMGAIPDFLKGNCAADSLFFLRNLQNYTQASRMRCLNQTSNENLTLTKKDCECLKHRQTIMQNTGWVMRILDAFGKVPVGFLDGNTFWLGDFQECRRINVEISSARTYQGQYCNLQIPVQISYDGSPSEGGSLLYACDSSGNPILRNLTEKKESPAEHGRSLAVPMVRYGVCIPDSCNGEFFQLFATALFNAINNGTTSIKIMNIDCHKPLDMSTDAAAIAMVAVSSLFLFVIVIGTAYDIFEYQPVLQKMLALAEKDSDGNQNAGDRARKEQECFNNIRWFSKFLLAFSVYTNGKKLLSIERREGQLESIHGIRFVSMTWVILGHTYYFSGKWVDNLKEFSTMLTEFPTQAIMNATVSVDTFFLMSGLLLTYLWLKDTEKRKARNITNWFHWVMFYVHRYIRLTPVYALLLGLDLALFKYLTDGPLWNQKGVEPTRCHSTWWTNLLYVNNLVYTDLDNLCFGWSWYLALDMQFHLLAPIMLILFWYLGYLAVALGVALILASCGVNAYLQDYYNVAPNAMWTLNPSQFDMDPLSGWLYYKNVYIKPWTRCGPYLVGMLVGYALFKVRNRKFKLNKWLNFFCWLTAATVNILVLYGLYGISRGDVSSRGFNAFYEAVNRPAWAAGVAWVIFACSTGNGGFVNTMMSWNMIFPLSRLTYCAYLIHPLVIYLVYQGGDRPLHFKSHYTMVYYFVAHFAIAYAAAAVISLAFESPVLTLEKLIFPRDQPPKSKQHPPPEDPVTKWTHTELIKQYGMVGEYQSNDGAPNKDLWSVPSSHVVLDSDNGSSDLSRENPIFEPDENTQEGFRGRQTKKL